ncbi:hypothetical protein Lepto7375DRAFT_7770 [Leptolyngbya sp. PCC 7375]|nr:hypothetical protein Lepto7375DRAFT_7770 [Leptolyngbya sp. PCC 7375]
MNTYLICFVHNPLHHAKHYLGKAKDVTKRIQQYEQGTVQGCYLLLSLNKPKPP